MNEFILLILVTYQIRMIYDHFNDELVLNWLMN